MNKILTIEQAYIQSEVLRKQGERIILVGGCFDILHVGHTAFLQNAKALGDVLFVALESDETIKKIKGSKRPINTHKDRAAVLACLEPVDYVIMLPAMKSDTEYDIFTLELKPAIIATTKGDKARHHKERQAKIIGGKVIDAINRIHTASTTKLAKLLAIE